MATSTPASLANHSAYQTNYHKRLVSLGLPYLLASGVIETFLHKIVDRGAFYLRMQRPKLPLAFESKRIKSQVETEEGTTLGGSEARRQVTRELFGANIERMRKADFPKYGYLAQADPHVELFMGDEMAYQYGNVLLTLKKDRLFHRTTLTVGMSLCLDVSSHIVPTRVDNIRATCVPGLNVDPRAPISPRSLNIYLYLANAIATGRITPDNFDRITQIMGPDVPSFTFFELQYHGPVTLDDVERIDLYSEDDPDYLEDMERRCSLAGIPFKVHTLI